MLKLAPLCSALYQSRAAEFDDECATWEAFGQWMAQGNAINVDGLTEFFHREQHEYLLQTAQWCQLRQSEARAHTSEPPKRRAPRAPTAGRHPLCPAHHLTLKLYST